MRIIPIMIVCCFASLPVSHANAKGDEIDIEVLRHIVIAHKSMKDVLYALGTPYHVGLSSEDEEDMSPRVADSVVFYYERELRLSRMRDTHQCRILIYYENCQVKAVNLDFFGIDQKILQPEEIATIFGNDKRVIYKRFSGDGPESDLTDSDKSNADVEIWIYEKHGLRVNIFKKYGNQVGGIDIFYKLSPNPNNTGL